MARGLGCTNNGKAARAGYVRRCSFARGCGGDVGVNGVGDGNRFTLNDLKGWQEVVSLMVYVYARKNVMLIKFQLILRAVAIAMPFRLIPFQLI